MSAGQRPGGLTALAVINFVVSAWHALSMLGVVIMLALPQEMLEEAVEKQGGELPSPLVAWLSLGLHALIAALLIVSGVGYLKQKLVLGRVMGNVYSILTLAGLAAISVLETFNLQVAIFMVYPLLTLVLINTIFRDDLVN